MGTEILMASHAKPSRGMYLRYLKQLNENIYMDMDENILSYFVYLPYLFVINYYRITFIFKDLINNSQKINVLF